MSEDSCIWEACKDTGHAFIRWDLKKTLKGRHVQSGCIQILFLYNQKRSLSFILLKLFLDVLSLVVNMYCFLELHAEFKVEKQQFYSWRHSYMLIIII